jgi:hypothetical protein
MDLAGRGAANRDDFALPRLADDSAALCQNARVRHLPERVIWIERVWADKLGGCAGRARATAM